jgi:hypothetical protein
VTQAISLKRISVAQWDGTTAGATEFLRTLAASKWTCLSLRFEVDPYIDRMRENVSCSARDQRCGRFLCARVGQRHFEKTERSRERRYRERFGESRLYLWEMAIVVGPDEWAVSLESGDQGPYLAIYSDPSFRTHYALV